MIDRNGYSLIALIAIQAACLIFFIYDVGKDLLEDYRSASPLYLPTEVVATLSLLVAIALEWRLFRTIREDRESAKRLEQVATGRVSELMQEHFRRWGLTASEADVAELTIKGCSISEIAMLRNSREGTIKSHLNAIYRKSGTKGRHELVCLLIEDLMCSPLVDREAAQEEAELSARPTWKSVRP